MAHRLGLRHRGLAVVAGLMYAGVVATLLACTTRLVGLTMAQARDATLAWMAFEWKYGFGFSGCWDEAASGRKHPATRAGLKAVE